MLALGGAAALMLAACSSSTPIATVHPSPTPLPAALDQGSYRLLVSQVLNDIGELTTLLSDVGIQLSIKPMDATLAARLVGQTKDAFELDRVLLVEAGPLPDNEQLHLYLLDALGLYADAAGALLPDPETQEADYWGFQELMLQAGKNSHAAIAAYREIGAPK